MSNCVSVSSTACAPVRRVPGSSTTRRAGAGASLVPGSSDDSLISLLRGAVGRLCCRSVGGREVGCRSVGVDDVLDDVRPLGRLDPAQALDVAGPAGAHGLEDGPLALLADRPRVVEERRRRGPVAELVAVEELQLQADAVRKLDAFGPLRLVAGLPLEGLEEAELRPVGSAVRLEVRGPVV